MNSKHYKIIVNIRKVWGRLVSLTLVWSPISKHKYSSIFLTTSVDLCNLNPLVTILGCYPGFSSPIIKGKPKLVIGWGRKLSGKRAEKIAKYSGSKLLLLEDGFIRSFDRAGETLSLVNDSVGIYYDASCPSQIEAYIARPLRQEEASRAALIIKKWKKLRLSKYNSEPDYLEPLPRCYVLVVDQVFGDLSVAFGNASSESFQRMLRCALEENPDATVIVKIHPDVFTQIKKGYFDIDKLKSIERVKIVSLNCHPIRLLEGAKKVYTVTSQLGFEALIWGKKVRCFGSPFYSGWGLSEDDKAAPARRRSVSLEMLVYGALVRYSKYVNPERRTRCEIEEVLDHVGLQRQLAFQYPSTLYAFGFSLWKKRFLKRFLMGSNLHFVKRVSDIPKNATLVVWGSKDLKKIGKSVKVLRIEDGFLRSAGLGADLIQPLSWIVDDMGIHYDSSRPSRLEDILQTGEFDPKLIERAQNLRTNILLSGVTKYNIKGEMWKRPHVSNKVILVPGQVESDASIRFGSPRIKRNVDLLRAVRFANPDAYVVYKPHPDVVSGLRSAGDGEDSAQEYCDELVTEVDSNEILASVDEVHTITSLIGFEALLRGVSVTCYGQPFYSSWGLTNDIFPVQRRNRQLSIDELIAGALIVYPRYISQTTRRFTTPETCVEELAKWRELEKTRVLLWRPILRSFLRLWKKVGARLKIDPDLY